MGTTQLPMETILDYLDSLKEVYTPESYDLFAHNCNNFTNDFAMFLVGRGIPDHITSLPKRVLDTPFGQMLKPQIDASMRSFTQVSAPPQSVPRSGATNGTSAISQQSRTQPSAPMRTNGASSTEKATPYGKVANVTTLSTLDKHIHTAANTAATIFFTSSTCAPCKLAYPMFDQLAERYPSAIFIKVDINSARDVAARYQIRATPNFMTFSKDVKQDEWAGADPNQLKANVERLMEQTFPSHPHTRLRITTLQFGSLKPVTYVKVPPLDRLMAKLGSGSSDKEMLTLRSFVEKRSADPREAKLPDLQAIGIAYRTKVLSLPVDVRFAAVDLLRCALVDLRVGGFFAEERGAQTVPALVKHVSGLEGCPHNLRLVMIHLACNLFISPLQANEMMRTGNALAELLIQLVTSSLLDASHPTTRVAAASLAFNLAVANYRVRREEGREALGESEQVELAACLLETMSTEENADAAKALMLALGYLVYCAPQGEELMDFIKTLDAKSTVSACKLHEALAKEVASLL